MAQTTSPLAGSALLGRSLPGRAHATAPGRRGGREAGALAVRAGVGDSMKKFFDSMAFENWAPRSSRTWRLGQGSGPRVPPEERQQQEAAQSSSDEAFISSLNARISQMGSVRESMDLAEEPAPPAETLSDATLAASFNSRLGQMAEPAQGDGDPPTGPLTGQLLRELVFAKYGKTYDLSIVRRTIAGVNIIALNIMWTHLEQKSFPMSEAQFADKLDAIAEYVRAWNQEEVVRKFLLEAPRSRRGLPSRPVTGNAVSIRLELEPSVVEEWFGGK